MKKTDLSCPVCGKPVQWSERYPHRPFCCERCKLIDLGAWAGESYRIPAQLPEKQPDEEE